MSAPDASLAGEAFCYITTTGRVTGRPHTIEIWFALHEGVLYVMAGSGFASDTVRNLQKQAAVKIRLRDVTYDALARLVTDEEEDQLVRRLLVEKYRSPQDDLESWGRTALPVAFEFTSPV
jgi:deazaflavin-dependent oxidoreductase (nitroreductase family)